MTRKKKQEVVRFKRVSCPALNVRNNPSTNALITKVLAKGTVVECDPNFINEGWDHIIADPNVEGYCMKKYLVSLDPDIAAVFHREPIVIHTDHSTCDSNEKVVEEEIKKNGKKD